MDNNETTNNLDDEIAAKKVDANPEFTADELVIFLKSFEEILNKVTEDNISGTSSGFGGVVWNLFMAKGLFDREIANSTTIVDWVSENLLYAGKVFNYLTSNPTMFHAINIPKSEYEDETWQAARYVDCINVMGGVLSGHIVSTVLAGLSKHPMATMMGAFIDVDHTVSHMNTVRFLRHSEPAFAEPTYIDACLNAAGHIRQAYVEDLMSKGK